MVVVMVKVMVMVVVMPVVMATVVKWRELLIRHATLLAARASG